MGKTRPHTPLSYDSGLEFSQVEFDRTSKHADLTLWVFQEDR